MTATADDILRFWFGGPDGSETGTLRKAWFAKNDAFDAEIAERFGASIEAALRGELDAWADEPRSALARILLLDQFTRNAFRGTPRAFAGDAQALAAARAMVGQRQDASLDAIERAFVYVPFEHAEGLDTQDECLRLFSRLADADARFVEMRDYSARHRAVIERYGRFPHRNAVLGRQSTAEEVEYLKRPGAGF